MLLTDWATRASKEAFKELTPTQKAVWRLCKQQGLSEEKAGCRLNISRKAVQERLIRASRTFKKHLELIKDCHESD